MDKSRTASLEIELDRRRVIRAAWWLLGVIVVIQVFRLLTDGLDLPGETLWRRLANVETENTFPTWLSAALFGLNAATAWILGRAEHRAGGRFDRHWRGLAVIMLVLSVDEIASFHEMAGGVIRRTFGLSGPFYYAWVIPGLILVAALTVVYLRFVTSMPRPVRNRIVLAAALFIGGAAGLEMLGGLFAETAARDGLGVALLATTEEAMELSGLIVLLDSFLTLAEQSVGSLKLGFVLHPRR